MLTTTNKKFAFIPFKAMLAIHFPRLEEGDKYGSITFDSMNEEIKRLDKSAYFFAYCLRGETCHGYFVSDEKEKLVKQCIYKHLQAQGALELLP